MMLFHSASVHLIGLLGLNCLINLAWLGLPETACLIKALFGAFGWLRFFHLPATLIQPPWSTSLSCDVTGPYDRVMYPCEPGCGAGGAGDLQGTSGGRLADVGVRGGPGSWNLGFLFASEMASLVGRPCGWK